MRSSIKSEPTNSSSRSPLESLPVFYTDRMMADAKSYSPSASKPAHVVEAWKKLGLPLTVIEPRPATRDEFLLAHSTDLVDGVLSLTRDNGFGNRLPEVTRSLPYTNGAMRDAAREAVANGVGAIAPVSGFHHAGYDDCAGFCTFNGLIVAARSMKRDALVQRVGILDFDEHYGDGTDSCIAELGLDWISHYTAGKHYGRAEQAASFLESIPELVEALLPVDVVLYQAGADPHVDDPLGGWLTTTELRERDRRVFQTCRRLGVPVAWNLAGGYQRDFNKVVEIHENTLRVCAETWL